MLKLALITTALNAESTIARTFGSVAGQCGIGEDFELLHLIKDGKSSDNTLKIAEDYKENAQYDVEVLWGSDRNFYDGLNTALAAVPDDVDVIGLINADDYLATPCVLAEIAERFQTADDIDAIYADLKYLTKSGKVHRHWRAGQFTRRKFRRGWMPPHPTVYVRKAFSDKLGGYRLDFGSAADYEWLVRLLMVHQAKLTYIPEVTVCMRSGGQSNDGMLKRFTANRLDVKAWKVNNLSPSLFFQFFKPFRKILQFLR